MKDYSSEAKATVANTYRRLQNIEGKHKLVLWPLYVWLSMFGSGIIFFDLIESSWYNFANFADKYLYVYLIVSFSFIVHIITR